MSLKKVPIRNLFCTLIFKIRTNYKKGEDIKMITNNISLPGEEFLKFVNQQLDSSYRFDRSFNKTTYTLTKISKDLSEFTKNPFGELIAEFDVNGQVIRYTDESLTSEIYPMINYISDCIIEHNNNRIKTK